MFNKFKGAFQGLGMKMAAASPEIMLVGGIISVLTATVYACTKTEQAKKAIDEAKYDAMAVETALVVPEESNIDILPETKKQLKMEKGRQYLKICGTTAYKFIKIYGVAALLWFGGMGMIVGGHRKLRIQNRHLAADIFASGQLLKEYRDRVAKAVGEEAEEKIFMGMQEETVNVLEKNQETGEEKIVQKKANVFHAQPGSIFARNFNEETSDAFDIRSFADYYLENRIDAINTKLEVGVYRAMNGFEILRALGFNENALGDDESIDKLLHYGISGNARKVPDPEMRRLKVTRLRGYQKKWDPTYNMEVYEPCLRLDFNFYPLEGKI